MKKCTLIFPVHGGSIFLGIKQQKYGAGLYNGWGGKHKDHDTFIESTALREFREETGGATFEFKDLEEVAIIEFYRKGEPLFECHVYFLHKWHGKIRATSEMGRPKPFPKAAMPYGKMMASDAKWLPLVFDPNRKGIVRGKAYYSDDMTEVNFVPTAHS
jgi:hypothetical protein